jgi:hypothetical protein
LKGTLQEDNKRDADIRENKKLLQVLSLKYKSTKGNGYNMCMERGQDTAYVTGNGM